jgi:hypothetical protein
MFDRIVVAYHGTERALKAIDAAVEIARRQDVTLHMLSLEEGVARHAELTCDCCGGNELQFAVGDHKLTAASPAPPLTDAQLAGE